MSCSPAGWLKILEIHFLFGDLYVSPHVCVHVCACAHLCVNLVFAWQLTDSMQRDRFSVSPHL